MTAAASTPCQESWLRSTRPFRPVREHSGRSAAADCTRAWERSGRAQHRPSESDDRPLADPSGAREEAVFTQWSIAPHTAPSRSRLGPAPPRAVSGCSRARAAYWGSRHVTGCSPPTILVTGSRSHLSPATREKCAPAGRCLAISCASRGSAAGAVIARSPSHPSVTDPVEPHSRPRREGCRAALPVPRAGPPAGRHPAGRARDERLAQRAARSGRLCG